jgi:hypothetical protein
VAVQRLSNSGRSGFSYKSLIAGITPLPSVPTIGAATAVNFESVNVAFTAPGAYAGSTFTATSSPGGLTATSATSPILVEGLSGSTEYTFTVTATNATGTSGASAASSPVTTPAADNSGMFPLNMVSVGSSSASYIEFTSIPQTYKHLQIRFFAGFNTQPGFASGKSYLNGDTTNTNYKSHQLYGDGATVAAAAYSVPYLPISTGPDNYPCSYVIDLLDYTSTSKYKTIRALGGWDANGSGQIILGSAIWLNTAAVTSYRIQCDGGYDWKRYTSAALYGIKGE